jgi:hypothetical protein
VTFPNGHDNLYTVVGSLMSPSELLAPQRCTVRFCCFWRRTKGFLGPVIRCWLSGFFTPFLVEETRGERTSHKSLVAKIKTWAHSDLENVSKLSNQTISANLRISDELATKGEGDAETMLRRFCFVVYLLIIVLLRSTSPLEVNECPIAAFLPFSGR